MDTMTRLLGGFPNTPDFAPFPDICSTSRGHDNPQWVPKIVSHMQVSFTKNNKMETRVQAGSIHCGYKKNLKIRNFGVDPVIFEAHSRSFSGTLCSIKAETLVTSLEHDVATLGTRYRGHGFEVMG